jgi:hypothetical protein
MRAAWPFPIDCAAASHVFARANPKYMHHFLLVGAYVMAQTADPQNKLLNTEVEPS